MDAFPVALRFAYDGSRFGSYARRAEGGSVEEALVAALGPEGLVEGSWRTGSRTDGGVSALGNVARVELQRPHLRGLVPAVQAGLPAGLWLLGAARVAPGWNPRHAVARHYAYFAADSGQDLARMRAAAQAFLGVHDMHHFARMEPHRAPRREVTRFDVAREEGWRFDVAGPSFLWNQVRRMVGAVLAVGAGEAAVEDVSRALSGGPRHAAFQVAGPEGLLLIAVDYDGLTWDDEAGRLGRRAVQRPMQEARVRLELLRRLGGA